MLIYMSGIQETFEALDLFLYYRRYYFNEIFALFEFSKSLRNIILKYCLEIEIVIKSIIAKLYKSKVIDFNLL